MGLGFAASGVNFTYLPHGSLKGSPINGGPYYQTT